LDYSKSIHSHLPSPAEWPGTVGVVSGELMRYSEFIRSLHRLEMPNGTMLRHSCGLEVARNRNELARDVAGEWLFMVDDDQVLLPGTLKQLLGTLREGYFDVVAPLVLRRTPPWQTVAYLRDPQVDPTPFEVGFHTGVVEVEAVGTGAILIHRRVFDKLEKPYFRVGQLRSEYMQEDVEFCKRVREAGFTIGVDTSCPVGHLTTMAVWPGRDAADKQLVALVGRNGTVVPVYPDDLQHSAIQPDLVAAQPEETSTADTLSEEDVHHGQPVH
jgi:hypothetical protein